MFGIPPSGGPTKEAIPWNIRSRPKAFVKFSKPNKSTKMTEVNPENQRLIKVFISI